MENERTQLLERLKTANNVLVTVSADPSVDQLSAAIGLTLMLNKVGKHATAVFSGKVPSTIEFLQPEKTIEKNTDSLRDFIIALDKTKADKLRYKVEDSHVKIFITPYRTSISDKDLEFSQGDFNVEVVIALGVKDQKDLDKAITAHGRILHDATTISITSGSPSTLGNINWDQSSASSLCEMVAGLADDLGQGVLDGQMATALMTGVVAETERFRNAKTTPATMSLSSALMSAGANQQLIATKLEEEQTVELAPKPASKDTTPAESVEETDQTDMVDGALQIEHPADDPAPKDELPEIVPVQIDEEGNIAQPVEDDSDKLTDNDNPPESKSKVEGGGSLILEPPTLGGKLTANTEPEHLDPATDALGDGALETPLLEHQETTIDDAPTELSGSEPEMPVDLPEPSMDLPSDAADPSEQTVANTATDTTESSPKEEADQTLSELEAVVQESYGDVSNEQPAIPEDPAEVLPTTPPAPTADSKPTPDLGDARDAVSDALASIGQPLEPIQALNSQPFDINLNAPQPLPDSQPSVAEQDSLPVPAPDFTIPDSLIPPAQPLIDPTAAPAADPTAPPTVPPPFMPDIPALGQPLPPTPSPSQPDNSQPSTSSNNPFNLPPA